MTEREKERERYSVSLSSQPFTLFVIGNIVFDDDVVGKKVKIAFLLLNFREKEKFCFEN